MAKIGAKGNGRIGEVKTPAQVHNSETGWWAKRDTSTGRFLVAKKSGGSFKGVRREK